jgi:hypothetical protein
MFSSGESGTCPGGLSPDEPDVPENTAASWRTAETQLFSALLSRPDLYQDVTVLVGLTVDRLRRLGPTTTALLEASARITELVHVVLEESGLRSAEIRSDVVGRAALALRHREVVGEQASARRRDLLAAARATGTAWVVLEEVGEWEGDPLVPYRRLEAEAATGRLLLVTATPDDDFRSSRHAVQELHVDLDTGLVEQTRGDGQEPRWHPSAVDREARATTLRECRSRSG